MRLETLAGASIEPELARELDGLQGARPRRRSSACGACCSSYSPMELDRSGLGVALEGLPRAGAAPRTGWSASSRTAPLAGPAEAVRTLLFRVAREALANVRNHAKASHVEVHLDDDSTGFSLMVRDDGKGFDAEQGLRVRPGHLGLPAMRERVEIDRGAPEGGEPAGRGHGAARSGCRTSSTAAGTSRS